MEAARVIPVETMIWNHKVVRVNFPPQYLIECKYRWQMKKVDNIAENFHGKRIGEVKCNAALRECATYEFTSKRRYLKFQEVAAKLIFRTTQL